jgi:ligand-binding sensor domain-containing protein
VLNYIHNPANPEKSVSSNFVRVVCEDNNGFLWIGTKKGLDHLTVETGVFKHYDSEGYNNRQLSNESVWALLKDNQGTIWVGTYFGGINYFNPDINFYTFHNLQNGVFLNKPFPIISNIVEDEHENLYLCSEGNGLIYYNVRDKSYRIFKADETNTNSLSNENIKAAYFDRQTRELWLGTHLGGLCMLNTETGRFIQYRNIKPEWSQTNILSTIQPYKGNLLVGTHGGLFLFDRQTRTFSLFSTKLHKTVSFIQDAKIDKSNNLWVAGINGVYRYNLKTTALNSFVNNVADSSSLSNNNAAKILVDSKNRIWIGTSGGGVNLFNPKTNSFIRYDRVHIGLDYFDASINRIGAYVSGVRSTQKALLQALLEPIAKLNDFESKGQFFERMALLEEAKSMPWGAVYNYYCATKGVIVGDAYIADIQKYEQDVTLKRI